MAQRKRMPPLAKGGLRWNTSTTHSDRADRITNADRSCFIRPPCTLRSTSAYITADAPAHVCSSPQNSPPGLGSIDWPSHDSATLPTHQLWKQTQQSHAAALHASLRSWGLGWARQPYPGPMAIDSLAGKAAFIRRQYRRFEACVV